jgi:hypothetical protein
MPHVTGWPARLLCAALVLGFSLMAVSAQQRPPAPPPAGNVEASIAQLHQKLQIAPAQEGAFNAFAQTMRENARSMPNIPPPRPGAATAVDGLRMAIQMTEAELAGMKRTLPALETLYNSLSPAQKKTADTVFSQGPGG